MGNGLLQILFTSWGSYFPGKTGERREEKGREEVKGGNDDLATGILLRSV